MPHRSEKNTSPSVVTLKEVEDRMSRKQILEMADIFKLSDEDLDERKIIFPKMHDKKLLNTFRDLRTRVIDKAEGKNFTLMVASVCNGGGGSFVAVNLAASIALDHGKTALIVDCNLQSPSTEYLVEGTEQGFSNYLENPAVSIEEIIYATGVPRLRLIPVGSAVDIGPEYYTSYRMQNLIEEIRSRYADRYIILDVPPIDTAADARILAENCDLALIVVPFGKVTDGQVSSAIEAIPADKLIGLVFNN
jgi:Mrp family chromosome partitioning ATPase